MRNRTQTNDIQSIAERQSKKILPDLQLYRLNDRAFQRQHNQALSTYSWSEYVMT